MSVTSVQLQKQRSGQFGADSNSLDFTYVVETDDPNDHQLTVLNAMPFEVGDQYSLGNESDSGLVCSAVKPNAINSTSWRVKVSFSDSSDQPPDNPLNEPAQIELVFAQGEKLLERDVYGKPIRNTVGDRFDDVITREDSQPVLRITRNEPESQALFGVDLRDTVNRTVWLGSPRRTVKFQPPTLRSRHHKEIGTYYEKGYEFKFSDETWRFILLNQGYYRLSEPEDPQEDPQRIRITDGDGNDIAQPVALTRPGQPLPRGQEPVFLEFDGYRESQFPNFNVLSS